MATNPIDLTTVDGVQAYLKLNAGAAIVTPEAASYDDDLIQGMITGLSQHWLTQTGRASLNSTADVTEVYDGTGSYHLFTDNWPINTVATVQVGNQTIPASSSFAAFGYFIERSKKSIAIRPGGSPQKFWSGIGNILLEYNYGYDGTPADIGEAVTWQVAQAYRRREHVDKKSITMGGSAGSTTYYDWEWSPDVLRVLNSYKRVAVR